MITISNTIKSIGNILDRIAKARVQSWLIRMGRDWTENNGYNHDDILVGVSKWPWRRSLETVAVKKEIKRTVSELKSYSDRELTDMDIPRGKIEHMARYGKSGVEFDTENAA